MKTGWLAGIVFVVAMTSAQAQQVDSRWAPWLGCWQLVDEDVREAAPAAAGRTRFEGTRVCVVPADTAAGVTLSTRIDDQPVLEQTIVADGAQHPVDEAGCRGWQRAEWSRTGERLFARAELACTNEAPRSVSGLATITGSTWIDVQAIGIAGREHVRVRRYRKADGQPGAGIAPASRPGSIAPRLGATRFTLEDVKEAAATLSPRAVEAALVETNASFDLNSRALVDLDQAGVPDSVIDLMVALSFPTRFIVDRARPRTASTSTSSGLSGLYSSWPYDGLLYDGFWDSPYVPYYYSPFGYSYWAGYGMPYYPLAGFVTIDRAAPSAAESTGGARLVNGAGYTQIRSRDPQPVESSTGSSGTRLGGSSSSDGPSSSGGSSGGSSSGASSGGYSSGGSSTDTGRTAEPR